jgi:flagellar hook-basal body complex protein FliE
MISTNPPSAPIAGLSGAQEATRAVVPAANTDPQTLAGEDFAAVFKAMLANVNQSQQHARTRTEAFDRGEHQDLLGAMIAQQQAKLAFQTTLQIRNKLTAAYQDIMNMPV